MKKAFMAVVLILMTFSSFAQNPTVQKFWETIPVRYKYHFMTDAFRAWLYSIGERKTNSPTLAQGLIENLPNEKGFQDEIFLSAYVGNQNKENLRLILGNLCGSFSLGNPVADYVIEKYKNDPRAVERIKKNQANAQRQEAAKKEKDRLRDEKEKQESLARDREYDERKNLEYKEKARQKFADSIIDVAYYFEDGIGGKSNRKNQRYYDQSTNHNFQFDEQPNLKGGFWSVGETQNRNGQYMNDLWQKYQSKNLNYPSNAPYRIKGTVFVSFTVSIDGEVENEKIVVGIGKEFDKEAIDLIIGTSGKWKPAKKDGKKVAATILLGVDFN